MRISSKPCVNASESWGTVSNNSKEASTVKTAEETVEFDDEVAFPSTLKVLSETEEDGDCGRSVTPKLMERIAIPTTTPTMIDVRRRRFRGGSSMVYTVGAFLLWRVYASYRVIPSPPSVSSFFFLLTITTISLFHQAPHWLTYSLA